MHKIYTLTIIIFGLFLSSSLFAQDVFWFEDFDNAAATRWDVTGNHPTPAGIPGLVYGTNTNFDYFVINDANTPELSGPISIGPMSSQGQFVRGHHYDCAAPSNLPNPYVNTGAVNRSLHITAQAGCAGIIYFGTPGYDDWNCITASGTDFPLTQTEQFAAYNSNIDFTGKCNVKLTADFFLGGSANGLEAHSTILYSIDGGATWKIVQDNLANCIHTFAGTCNDWARRSFEIPADANNQPDVRIAFRWTEDGNTINNTQDYALGASFNVDNVMLSSCSGPAAEFVSQSGTDVCKNIPILFNSTIASNAGLYINCFSPLVDNCPAGSYAWTFTQTSGVPAAVNYVGGTSSSDPNPQVEFTGNGTWTVELVVSSCGGSTTVTKTNFITVADCPPNANYAASNNLACALPTADQDTITFTDMSSSTAPITAYLWTFNPATVTFVNGTSATDPNPQVVFDALGVYEVSLQVTSAEGSDTETRPASIEAIDCDCGGGAGGPINLYTNNFSAANGFTLNTVEPALGTTAGNENNWVRNASYAGGFFPATPNRGGGTYLHIHSNFACGFFGECQAAFNADNSGQKSFARSPIINAAGATGVSVSFWMLNASSGANGRARLYYSIDGGATWILKATYNSIPGWTFQTYIDPAFDNQANLRFGFYFDTGFGGAGVADPAFSVDDMTVDAAGAAALPNTWEGTASTDWGTAGNWSFGTVPIAADDVLVPTQANLVGTFMPTIAAPSFANNVCNYGVITLVGNNTLTIDSDLLNEGVITTDNVVASSDVIFANSPSTYRGSGTMFDVDVAVNSSNLTFESDMTPRSFIMTTPGSVDLATYTLSINKNLAKTAGTFNAMNGEIHFIDACGTCVDLTSNANVILNANQVFGNVLLNKTAGVVTSLVSAVNHTFNSPKTLTIQSGIWDANTNTVDGTGNLTMTGGEYQTAKCATVVPELTGAYALTGGQVTFDGSCNQTTKTGVPGASTTIFTEDFESPNIANNALIAGNIPVWTEAGTSAAIDFRNDEGSGLTSQTANVRHDWDFATPTQVETLSYGPINFGGTTTNPQLVFDYENNDNSGVAQVRIEVLYKSSFASPWTVGATYNHTAPSSVNLANVVPLAGASSDFYIGFRVTIFDAALGCDGEVSIDNISVTADGLPASINYYDAEFTGTGVKTLDNGNMNVNNQLFLNLPTTLGNYINTGTDTLYVFNPNTTAVVRTGGHIVGYLGRDVNATDMYTYDVGSDNAGGDTYYEPIVVTTTSLIGPNNIVAKFYDDVPNPTTVSNVTFNIGSSIDTVKQVEQEGYWHLHENLPLIGGLYTARVSPSNFWSLSKPWGQDYYALLKQDALAQPWDFNNGGIRSNDSTTAAFTDFSNYALAFADTTIIPTAFLPITLLRFDGEKKNEGNLLAWITEKEIDSDFFELERSVDGITFSTIATLDAAGQSSSLQYYQHLDNLPVNGWNYYRLKQVDEDQSFEYSHIVALDNRRVDVALKLYPNPATDIVTFDYLGANLGEEFMVQIFDVSGRKLIENQYQPTDVRVRESISTKDFPSGVYFVQFTNGLNRESRKLIIVD